MTWTTISSFTNSQLVDETDMNNIVGNLEYLKDAHNYVELHPHTQISSLTSGITFSSIPNDFATLRLRLGLRTSVSSLTDEVLMRFNNNTSTSNYASYFADHYGTSPSHRGLENRSTAGVSGIRMYHATGNTTTSTRLGIFDVTIFNYASTSQRKFVVYQSSWIDSTTSTGNMVIGAGQGFWNQSSAITEIDLVPNSSTNFTLGFYSLMGVGS